MIQVHKYPLIGTSFVYDIRVICVYQVPYASDGICASFLYINTSFEVETELSNWNFRSSFTSSLYIFL